MTAPDSSEITREAKKIRLALEACKEPPFTSNIFPVASCKYASLLLAYHALRKWPSITIHGVGGIALDRYGSETISHYWIEYQDTAIDLTADQYNLIDDEFLNFEITTYRPFKPVSTGLVGRMHNYKLFKIAYRDTYVSGFPELAEDFLYELQSNYKILKDLAHW